MAAALLALLLAASCVRAEHLIDATASRAPAPHPLLVGTMDGSLHAFDVKNGNALWSINGGPLIDGTPQLLTPSSAKAVFLADPRDGSLYVATVESKRLQRVDKSLRELAEMGPFTASDGSMYIAHKTSRVIAVDPLTGMLQRQYAVHDPMMSAADPGSNNSMLIGRTEYTVACFERSGALRWNMTHAEYAHAAVSSVTGAQYFRTQDGKQLTITDDDGDVSWSRSFDVPVAHVYRPSASGALVKVPVRVVRALSSTSDGGLELTLASTPTGILYVIESPKKAIGGPTTGSTALAVAETECAGEAFPYCLIPQDIATALAQAHPIVPATPFPLAIAPQSEFRPVIALPPGPPAHPFSPPPQYALNVLSIALLAVILLLLAAIALLLIKRPPLVVPAPEPPAPVAAEQTVAAGNPQTGGEPAGATAEVPAASPDSKAAKSPGSPPATEPRRKQKARVEAIGKLTVDMRALLGHGSHGTIVFKGRYEGRDVAVKRILSEFVSVAEQEVELLRRADHHPNVVRYFCLEHDGEFAYIALQLCIATLVQVVEGPGVSSRGTHHAAAVDPTLLAGLDRVELARQFLSGIAFLHKTGIVHRDVKPQNVLLTQQLTAVISDFGLCATVNDDQSSFEATHAGTVGWVAPETLRNGRTTKAVDAFSAGCVLHYLMTGLHPYGAHFEREGNIRNGRRRIAKCDPLIDHTVLGLLQDDPDNRWSCTQALSAPLFWRPNKLLGLLQDVSDRVEKEAVGSPLVTLLETNAIHVVGSDWRTPLDPALLADLGRFRKYNFSGVVDLLRALRNKKHHYQELPAELRALLGDVPDGFLAYFTKRYPRLIVHVFSAVMNSCMRDEPPFRIYSEPEGAV
eukprot:m.118884 g.118884  ORF g.118884 m.118884 type:complete len:859 (-) comp9244_c0_seq2:291-2867(-)